MATETTLTSAKAWSPDLSAVAPEDAVPAALILQTSTVAGSVEGDAPSVRVMHVDDAAAGFVAEGVAIDEANPDLAECVVHTGKISQLLRLSREQWLQPNAQELLADSVRRAVTKAANAAYLTQVAPTPPVTTPPAGLINVSGVEDIGAIADDLDGLVDGLATLAGNGANPSHILMSPTAWASLRKFKAGSGLASTLLGVGADDAAPRLLGLPVIVAPALGAGVGMVLDQSAIISAVGDVQVSVSEHAYFAADSVALRCTWRFGANAVHPDRIGKFTVTDPS